MAKVLFHNNRREMKMATIIEERQRKPQGNSRTLKVQFIDANKRKSKNADKVFVLVGEWNTLLNFSYRYFSP